MSRTGIGGRLVVAVSSQSLRVAGLVTMALSAGVALTSIETDHGLAPPSATGSRTAAYAADAGTAAALVEFSMAHPAYPVAALVGVLLLVAGDDAPLLGS